MNFAQAAAVAAISLIAPALVHAQSGSPDPIFDAIPFARWLADGEQSQIRWSTRVEPARLSSAQRLRTRVDIEVEGEEVLKRKGRGALILLVQFEDAEHRLYQTHKLIDLREIQSASSKVSFVYSQDVFVLPGDYRVAMAVADSATRDFSIAERSLHVNALRGDPLPDLWRNLPAVEMGGDDSISGSRLNLPLETRRPLDVHIMVNTSPSLGSPGIGAKPVPAAVVLNGVLSIARVISQLRLPSGAFGVSLLDLTKRRVIYEQSMPPELDWAKLQAAVQDADPNVVDAHTLQSRGHSAQFFAAQVRHRIPPAEDARDAPPRVLIVVTAPTDFESGEDLHSIEGGIGRNDRIFYIRCHTLPAPQPFGPPEEAARLNRRTFAPPVPAAASYSEPIDALERTVKTLHPRVFDVYAPEDFRKTIRDLLDELAKM